MAIGNPRIGCNNILYDARGDVWATHEDTSYPCENACDWAPGVRWEPTDSINLLTNGDMLEWDATPEPDDWTKAGAGSTWTRTGT